METIIALRGKGNSGKTGTIRMLHDLMGQHGYQEINSNIQISTGDFSSVFSKKGKIIGITSSGDSYDRVHDRVQELINQGCYICVCACRTFDRIPPGTNAAIIEFANYQNQFIKKTRDDTATQSATNMNDAEQLLASIERLI
jgi:hypothetical protein